MWMLVWLNLAYGQKRQRDTIRPVTRLVYCTFSPYLCVSFLQQTAIHDQMIHNFWLGECERQPVAFEPASSSSSRWKFLSSFRCFYKFDCLPYAILAVELAAVTDDDDDDQLHMVKNWARAVVSISLSLPLSLSPSLSLSLSLSLSSWTVNDASSRKSSMCIAVDAMWSRSTRHKEQNQSP